MSNLDVFHIKLLEIAHLPRTEELSPVISFILWGSYQFLQRLYYHIMCRIEEKWNGKPLPFRVYHYPMLHALIPVVAPDLFVVQG